MSALDQEKPAGCADWLANLRGRIHSAQQRATLAVNRELVLLRAFAGAWPDEAVVQAVLAQLPWGHNLVLLDSTSACRGCNPTSLANRTTLPGRHVQSLHFPAVAIDSFHT